MHTFWFERPLPPDFRSFLGERARILGDEAGSDATTEFAEVDAIVAAAKKMYDAAFMDRAPNLKVISRMGAGYDNISVDEATRRGIAVCIAPDAVTISTAEHAIALMFTLAKSIHRARFRFDMGGHVDYFNQHNGLELHGLKLGLLGFGRIGMHVAQIARGIGMKVLVYDPHMPEQRAAEHSVTRLDDLDQLLATADVVSLHLPMSETTRHFIDAQRLARMKPEALLINTSRGGLIDEAALIDALREGRLRGAALDVTCPEPPAQDNPLLTMDNVIVTPHIAAATSATKRRLWQFAIENCLKVLNGESGACILNPEVLGDAVKS